MENVKTHFVRNIIQDDNCFCKSKHDSTHNFPIGYLCNLLFCFIATNILKIYTKFVKNISSIYIFYCIYFFLILKTLQLIDGGLITPRLFNKVTLILVTEYASGFSARHSQTPCIPCVVLITQFEIPMLYLIVLFIHSMSTSEIVGVYF